jgi:hypothetical protein
MDLCDMVMVQFLHYFTHTTEIGYVQEGYLDAIGDLSHQRRLGEELEKSFTESIG